MPHGDLYHIPQIVPCDDQKPLTVNGFVNSHHIQSRVCPVMLSMLERCPSRHGAYLNSWRDVSTRRFSFVSGLPTNGDPCIPAKATAHDPRSWSFKLPLIYLSNLSRTTAPRLQNHDATFGLLILASDEGPLIAVGGTEGMARPAVGRLVIAMRTTYGIRMMLAQYVNCRIIQA
ncbi:hypothetical protein IG631_19581 [Alternaria alternata]|nr:hypothetical protein IG631_19581 [Alternaria alternata]